MHTTLSNLKSVSRSAFVAASVVGLVLSSTLPAFAQPSDVSVTLGDSRVNETTTYTVDLTLSDGATAIGCFEVNYSTSFDGSDTVSSMDTSSATFDSTTLLDTGYAVDNTQSASNIVRVTNGTPAAPTAATGQVVLGGIVNGDTAETSYFATITTYSDSCTTEIESNVVRFVYTNGQEVSVTVEPTLTFDVAPVSASTLLDNGETSTVATTDGTIPFGAVSTGANGIAAHDLSIETNAQAGYDVSVRYTGQLTNSSSDVIDDLSPEGTTFPVAGNETFGYNADGNNSNWQAFDTSNETVLSSGAATSSAETGQVAYQVGISTSTDAGTYTTTVIYTATPTY